MRVWCWCLCWLLRSTTSSCSELPAFNIVCLYCQNPGPCITPFQSFTMGPMVVTNCDGHSCGRHQHEEVGAHDTEAHYRPFGNCTASRSLGVSCGCTYHSSMFFTVFEQLAHEAMFSAGLLEICSPFEHLNSWLLHCL